MIYTHFTYYSFNNTTKKTNMNYQTHTSDNKRIVRSKYLNKVNNSVTLLAYTYSPKSGTIHYGAQQLPIATNSVYYNKKIGWKAALGRLEKCPIKFSVDAKHRRLFQDVDSNNPKHFNEEYVGLYVYNKSLTLGFKGQRAEPSIAQRVSGHKRKCRITTNYSINKKARVN